MERAKRWKEIERWGGIRAAAESYRLPRRTTDARARSGGAPCPPLLLLLTRRLVVAPPRRTRLPVAAATLIAGDTLARRKREEERGGAGERASERGVGGADGEWQSAVNLWAGRGVETEAVACGAVLARPGGSGAGEKPRAPCRSGAGGYFGLFFLCLGSVQFRCGGRRWFAAGVRGGVDDRWATEVGLGCQRRRWEAGGVRGLL